MQNKLDNFCAFILSHENPNDVKTFSTLKRCNYSGKIYIVLDDEDTKIKEYQEIFGVDNVLLFSKEEVSKLFDPMDIEDNKNTVVYARNACFQLAKKLNIRYFIELDDDYYEMVFRYEEDNKLRTTCVPSFDDVVLSIIKFLGCSDKISSVALAQNGDYIGGCANMRKKKEKGLLRKAMNSFVCDAEKPFIFNGRINEDVNTYCLDGSRGNLFFTIVPCAINQIDTQQKKTGNGMADVYSMSGTYLKSFYTVLCCPSFVKIRVMGDRFYRIHHSVQWENAVPKIISDRFRK